VLALIFFLLSAILQASAQVAVHGPSLDQATLARANAGDAGAQIQMGDQSRAAASAIEHDPDQSAEKYQAAAAWYRKAADQGSITAQLRLAELYRDGGKGFPRDMAQAAEWYRKAADQGDADAQATLATLYSIGQGVAQSYVEAYFWLDLATSATGPRQQQYAQNRQAVGAHITTDELDEIKNRVAKWHATHPH
jgi:TPR repeat protein